MNESSFFLIYFFTNGTFKVKAKLMNVVINQRFPFPPQKIGKVIPSEKCKRNTSGTIPFYNFMCLTIAAFKRNNPGTTHTDAADTAAKTLATGRFSDNCLSENTCCSIFFILQ